MTDIDVDLVYTWVEDDEEHTRQKNSITKVRFNRGALDNRFRCNGEIQSSVRSALKFVPWVRNIFVVCADYQNPTFLTSLAPNIHIVHHSEIFEHKNHLPTFNSHSIEANLHRIPGLSEHFLYANDDMFFGAFVNKSKFFDSTGRAMFVSSGSVLHSTRPARNTCLHLHARYAIHKIMTKILNKSIRHPRVIHHVKPLTISMMNDMWAHPDIYPILKRTSGSRFRSTTDIWPVGMALYLGLNTGRCRRGYIRSVYYQIKSDTNLAGKFSAIMNSRPPLYCLNDDMRNPTEKFLNSYKRHLQTTLPHCSYKANEHPPRRGRRVNPRAVNSRRLKNLRGLNSRTPSPVDGPTPTPIIAPIGNPRTRRNLLSAKIQRQKRIDVIKGKSFPGRNLRLQRRIKP
jgi:hypothetical protein